MAKGHIRGLFGYSVQCYVKGDICISELIWNMVECIVGRQLAVKSGMNFDLLGA